jgi:hypothetical protein
VRKRSRESARIAGHRQTRARHASRNACDDVYGLTARPHILRHVRHNGGALGTQSHRYGQHAADESSFYVFDEASAVPDKIFEVAEGGLSDGQPFIFLYGNPTRSSGKLYRVCFGSESDARS